MVSEIVNDVWMNVSSSGRKFLTCKKIKEVMTGAVFT
jgi:hypothetical protein